MQKINFFRMIFMATLVLLTIPVLSQSFPSGGYQGGTHGNIKYTLWVGTVDNDWAEPGNWCPATVPDAQDAVVIPASASIMPEVKTTGQECKSLSLEPGAEVIVKDGFVLTVNGQEVE